jgi:hypothetical protein
MQQKHRRPGELSPGEVRAIIVARLRGTSRAVLCTLFNLSRATVRRIESGALHRETFAEVAELPEARKLRDIGARTDRASLVAARKLAAAITAPHVEPINESTPCVE